MQVENDEEPSRWISLRLLKRICGSPDRERGEMVWCDLSVHAGATISDLGAAKACRALAVRPRAHSVNPNPQRLGFRIRPGAACSMSNGENQTGMRNQRLARQAHAQEIAARPLLGPSYRLQRSLP